MRAKEPRAVLKKKEMKLHLIVAVRVGNVSLERYLFQICWIKLFVVGYGKSRFKKMVESETMENVCLILVTEKQFITVE